MPTQNLITTPATSCDDVRLCNTILGGKMIKFAALVLVLIVPAFTAVAETPKTEQEVIRLLVAENGSQMLEEDMERPMTINEWFVEMLSGKGENGEAYFNQLSMAKCKEVGAEVVCHLSFINNLLEPSETLQAAAEKMGINDWVFVEKENCAYGITTKFQLVDGKLKYKSGTISVALCGD